MPKYPIWARRIDWTFLAQSVQTMGGGAGKRVQEHYLLRGREVRNVFLVHLNKAQRTGRGWEETEAGWSGPDPVQFVS